MENAKEYSTAFAGLREIATMVMLNPNAVIKNMLEVLEGGGTELGVLCRGGGNDDDAFGFDPGMHELVARCCMVVMVETLLQEPHITESTDKGGRRERQGRDSSKGKKDNKKVTAPTELGRTFRNFLRANKIMRNKDGSGGMSGESGSGHIPI